MIGNKLFQNYLLKVELSKCPNVIATYLTLQQHFLNANLDIAQYSNLLTFNSVIKKLIRSTYIVPNTYIASKLSVFVSSTNESGVRLADSSNTQSNIISEYDEYFKSFECLLIIVPAIAPLNQNLLYCLAPNLDLVFEISENNDFRCVFDAELMKKYGLEKIADIQKCLADSFKLELDNSISDLTNIVDRGSSSLIQNFINLGSACNKKYQKYFNKKYPFSNSINNNKEYLEHYFQFILGASEYISSLTYAGDKLVLDYLDFTAEHFYYTFQECNVSLSRIFSLAKNFRSPKTDEEYDRKVFSLETAVNEALSNYDNLFAQRFFEKLKLSSKLPHFSNRIFYKTIEKCYTPVFFRIACNGDILNHEIKQYSGNEIGEYLIQRKLALVKNERQFYVDYQDKSNDFTFNNGSYSSKNFTNYNLFDDFANVKGSILKLETVLPVVIGSKQAERVSQLYFEYGLSDFFNNIIGDHFKAINQALCSIGTREEFLNNMSQLYDGLLNIHDKAQELKDEITFIGNKALEEIKREPEVI